MSEENFVWDLFHVVTTLMGIFHNAHCARVFQCVEICASRKTSWWFDRGRETTRRSMGKQGPLCTQLASYIFSPGSSRPREEAGYFGDR